MQTEKLTPMMQHYLKLKEQHKDHILFYRLGGFFEMFFYDATPPIKAVNNNSAMPPNCDALLCFVITKFLSLLFLTF